MIRPLPASRGPVADDAPILLYVIPGARERLVALLEEIGIDLLEFPDTEPGDPRTFVLSPQWMGR